MTAERLVVFTRFPEPHTTKTRLIPALGPDGAAELQRSMTRHMLRAARQLTEDSSAVLEVRFEGGDAHKMAACFGSDVTYAPQGPGDLGCRMARAVAEAFDQGMERTVIIGTDCPEISARLIREAFEHLATSDLVLGPAADGGYYLIGLRKPRPQLFDDMPWGGNQVLAKTMCRARALSLDVSLLKTLSDVDRPEDLPVWYRAENSSEAASGPDISVIIPTLNEADHLPLTLCSVGLSSNIETIVVDGGSSDATCEIAERAGCRLLRSPPGRALQMNAGARTAIGSILLFLHADTCLPEGFEHAVKTTLERRHVVAGAFRLRIGISGWPMRLIERAVELRSRVFQMPYGDQALFIRKQTFQDLAGFPLLPIMEDFEFVRRLQHRGRIRIVSLPVTTSGRRWQKLGPWRTTWVNQKVILGHCLGVSLRRLAAWYRYVPGSMLGRCPDANVSSSETPGNGPVAKVAEMWPLDDHR